MADPPVANFTTYIMTTLVTRGVLYWANQSNSITDSSDSSYSYDVEAFQREKHINLIMEIITIICFSLTMVVGTLGNILVIYTIWRCRNLHTVMYTLLASLSVADLIMVAVVLPWLLKLTIYKGTWEWGEVLCRTPGYLQLLSSISSVFHLAAISMERCYAVMFPLKSRTKLTIRNAYKIIVTVWISAAIASVPHLLSVGVVAIDMWGITIQFCMNVWNEEGKQAYSLYLFFIVFAIPLVQITGSYAFIIRTLYTRRIPSVGGKNGSIALNQSRKYKTGSTRNGNGSVHAPRTSSVYVANSTSKLNRNSTRNKEAEIRQMTTMLVVIIVLFAICWGPNLGFTVYSRFYLDPEERNIQKWRLISSALQLLSLMNSAWNPVIYALMSVSFRESCKWALQVCCKPRSVRRRMSTVSRANTVSRPGISAAGGSTAYDNVSESSHCVGEKL
ncbi:G-protein coupled receptor 54-like [Asterias rubens]|uniref:G-protein coupled receptor 54-like n=1 Tax=Asterias rubens TaxID=7604 RepID=UPI0014553C5D|nr:G-protein coupled receptor 54-like [Asterias rubens]